MANREFKNVGKFSKKKFYFDDEEGYSRDKKRYKDKKRKQSNKRDFLDKDTQNGEVE